MFSIDDPHQFFEEYDDDDVLICRWTMDKIKRKDGEVWVMNHFFINPSYEKKQQEVLAHRMETALLIAKESKIKIWPLDPMIIAYFSKHPKFDKYWYHKPY
ncbi:hypothetical protein PT285_09420 [Lactobacillus sp. ESL0791]|uniref:hypothetical protein n=1 Tax=Lactobacillus sp. ESL0791 TaxID=2983234 RepID=UPI0023F92AD0|nr:hypothetical protein [Lactobacillus sp. ESL0791]MDF7639618.1 hypothetical protein [Lactobacillus sp. ESL0791]